MTIRLSGSSKTLHRAISTETGNTCCVSRYPCLRSCSQCSRATGSKPKPRGSALALAPTRMTCSPGQQNAVSISTCTCTRKTTPTALRNGSRVIRRQAKLLAWTSSPTTNKVNTVWQQAAIVTEHLHTCLCCLSQRFTSNQSCSQSSPPKFWATDSFLQSFRPTIRRTEDSNIILTLTLMYLCSAAARWRPPTAGRRSTSPRCRPVTHPVHPPARCQQLHPHDHQRLGGAHGAPAPPKGGQRAGSSRRAPARGSRGRGGSGRGGVAAAEGRCGAA